MIVNAISPVSRVSFNAHYTNVDIGASTIYGSLKIAVLDEDSNPIANGRYTVFKEGEARDEETFQKNTAEKIAEFEAEHKAEILKNDADDEMKLTVCYPGPNVAQNNPIGYGFNLSNFFYDNKRKQRFKKSINPAEIDAFIINRGINLVQSRHVNDMAGAGACILKQIQKTAPEVLKPGEEILYIYPGGGIGSGVISVDNNGLRIRPSEIQHIKRYGTNNDSVEMDAKADALRKNFDKELSSLVGDKISIGENTKAVTDYKELVETAGFVEADDFNKASKAAISKFMDAISQLIAVKICESKLHNVVLTGAIVNGVHDSVNINPEFKMPDNTDESDKFKAILSEKVKNNLTDIGKNLFNANGLNIMILAVKDNTQGSELLQKGEPVGLNWFNVAN